MSSKDVPTETICKGSGTIVTAEVDGKSVGTPIDGDPCCISDCITDTYYIITDEATIAYGKIVWVDTSVVEVSKTTEDY